MNWRVRSESHQSVHQGLLFLTFAALIQTRKLRFYHRSIWRSFSSSSYVCPQCSGDIGDGIILIFLHWFDRNVYLSVVSIEMTLEKMSSNDPAQRRRIHIKKLWYSSHDFTGDFRSSCLISSVVAWLNSSRQQFDVNRSMFIQYWTKGRMILLYCHLNVIRFTLELLTLTHVVAETINVHSF